MQLAVPEVTDLDGETAATTIAVRPRSARDGRFRPRLPAGPAAARARRAVRAALLRRLVRQPAHQLGRPRETCGANHGQEAPRIDRPVAGLLRDLRQRGMLDDTLVLFTTEFGRTPFAQSAADVGRPGRDHNSTASPSGWPAPASSTGTAYGATDEIGWKATEKPPSPGTISTPPCCTCWASTTSG